MHTNVYSDEGGIEGIEFGWKHADNGNTYPYMGIKFKNGNAVTFFGKTTEELGAIINELNHALFSLVNEAYASAGGP